MISNLNKRLEEATCFSKSKLWLYITEFYLSQGPKAWDHQIPYLVTNSQITANHHAHIILKHAKGPYTIIDYGAGVGQHGYYLAKRLTELAPIYQKPIEWFSIYLAEISKETQKSWKTNPDLKYYIDSKLIIPFSLSGQWLSDLSSIPKSNQHCLIANYLLDSMPFTAYENHQKVGLSIYTKRKYLPQPTLDQLILKPFKLSKTPHTYPKLEKHYGTKRYTIPHIAIEFIQQYFSQTHDALMIINDKMFLNIDDLDYDLLFNLTLEGCYSTTLNMDAILQICPELKTQVTNHCERLQTVVLSHHNIPKEDSLNCSDVASLFEHYKQQKNITARHCFSIAKSLSYEPFCIELFSQFITPDNTTESQLLSLISICQKNTYHKSHPFIYLHSAKILRRCLYFNSADQQLEMYLKVQGEHPAYHLEKGILYYSWGKTSEASEHLKFALQDNRTAKTAKTLLEKINLSLEA